MTEAIHTSDASAPGGAYSQAIRFGPGMIVTAGQVGIDSRTGELEASLQGQVERALSNLEAVLRAAGMELSDVVKTTCFLTRIGDFEEFDAIYRTRFSEPLPARSTMGVALAGDLLFEIEAWAWKSA